MIRKYERKATTTASRCVRVSSSFSPENSSSSMMPEVRPKIVRCSNQTPSIATAAMPRMNQREGSGARLSAK